MAGAARRGHLDTLSGQVSAAARQRPALLTVAAVLMFLLAGSVAKPAIVVLVAHATGSAANVEAAVGDPFWMWCIFDGAFALLAVYAGVDILRGVETGRILGFFVAGFSALSWLVVISAALWAVLMVIAIDLLAIYALATQGDYFRRERTSPR